MLEPPLTWRARLDRRRRWLLPLLGAASIWGCGGRAALESDEDVSGIAGQSGGGGVAGGSGGNQGMMVIDRPADGMVLPECVLGFRESSARGRECTFVHERRCYENELLACACACPMGGRCIIGGFLDPDGPFPVSCSL